MKGLVGLLFCLVFVPIKAQNFVYDDSSVIVKQLFSSSANTVDMFFKTAGPEEIQFEWEVVSNTFPSGWLASICDFTTCYSGIPSSGSMTPITADLAATGTKVYFTLTIEPGLYFGNGVLKIYVYDGANYARGDTVIFDLTNLNTLSIEPEFMGIQIYPNPANAVFYLNNLYNITYNYRVLSLDGKVILNGILKENDLLPVSCDHFLPGIYWIELTGPNHVQEFKRITIS